MRSDRFSPTSSLSHGKLLTGELLRGHVYEVTFRGMTMLPVNGLAWRIREAHQLAHGFRNHGCIILLADHGIAEPILFKQRRSQTVVAKATAAFPTYGLRDPTSGSSQSHVVPREGGLAEALMQE